MLTMLAQYFWQLKIGRRLKRPVWKFPGGLSDEGESIGGFDLLSICSFIFGVYFTEYNHEDLKVVFLRCWIRAGIKSYQKIITFEEDHQ